jgi:hypothetical protein
MLEALSVSSTTGIQASANKETPVAPDEVRLKAREQFTLPAEAQLGKSLTNKLIWGFP